MKSFSMYFIFNRAPPFTTHYLFIYLKPGSKHIICHTTTAHTSFTPQGPSSSFQVKIQKAATVDESPDQNLHQKVNNLRSLTIF